jgi:hypothetical protein
MISAFTRAPRRACSMAVNGRPVPPWVGGLPHLDQGDRRGRGCSNGSRTGAVSAREELSTPGAPRGAPVVLCRAKLSRPPALRGPSCAGFVGKGSSQGGGGMCVRAGATSIPLSMPFDIAVASAVKTIWAKARPKRCPRPGRRSDHAPPINDRASAGPTTRS